MTAPGWGSAPPARRRSTFGDIVVYGGITLAAIVGGVVLLGALLLLPLWLRDKPEADDSSVRRSRRAGVASLAASVSAFERDVLFRVYGETRLVFTDTTDECTEGQHNWKIDDPYDLSCTARVQRVRAADALPSYRAAALNLDTALAAAGWTPSSPDRGLRWVVSDYWDRISLSGQPPLDGNRDGRYGPADLPSVTYRATDNTSVTVSFTEPGLVRVSTEAERATNETLAPGTYGVQMAFQRTTYQK